MILGFCFHQCNERAELQILTLLWKLFIDNQLIAWLWLLVEMQFCRGVDLQFCVYAVQDHTVSVNFWSQRCFISTNTTRGQQLLAIKKLSIKFSDFNLFLIKKINNSANQVLVTGDLLTPLACCSSVTLNNSWRLRCVYLGHFSLTCFLSGCMIWHGVLYCQ